MNRWGKVATVLVALWVSSPHTLAADAPAVKKVPTATVLPQPPGGRTLAYRKTLIDANDELLGVMERGTFCSDGAPFRMNKRVAEFFGGLFYGEAGRLIKRLGYAKASEPSAFATRAPDAPDYELAASVKAMALRICSSGPRDNAGEVWLQMRWEVFSPKLQRVVLAVTSEGSFDEPKKVDRSFEDFIERTFASAMLNALADPAMARRLSMDPGVDGTAAESVRQDTLAVLREAEPQDGQDGDYSAQRSAVASTGRMVFMRDEPPQP